MAQTIKIKRSELSAPPASLSNGELAFTHGDDKLHIGDIANNVKSFDLGGGASVVELGNVDIDTIITAGVYKVGFAFQVSPANNWPLNNQINTILVVQDGDVGTIQTVTYINGITTKSWVRSAKNNNTGFWSDWEILHNKILDPLGTQDLNDIISTPELSMIQSSSASATPANNYPIEEAGYLELVQVGGDYLQRYTSTIDHKLFLRSRPTGTNVWTAWVEVGGGGGGGGIPDSVLLNGVVDLNTLFTVGIYNKEDNVTFANNFPEESLRSSIEVVNFSDGLGLTTIQTVRTRSTKANVYTRVHNGISWGTWERLNIQRDVSISTIDLNSIGAVDDSGEYFQGDPANSTLARHYPVESPGLLTVSVRFGAPFQMYRPNFLGGLHNGKVFFRSRDATGWWEPWLEVGGGGVVGTITLTYQQDLNTIYTTGHYYMGSNGNANVTYNYPENLHNGILEVIDDGTGANRVIQRYTSYDNVNSTQKVWVRNSYNGWSVWVRMGVAGEGGGDKPDLTNENLNSLLDSGSYDQPATANGVVLNYPTAAYSGRITVTKHDTHVFQESLVMTGGAVIRKIRRSSFPTIIWTQWFAD